MTAITLNKLYEVPSETDGAGHVWRWCLYDASFATSKVGWAIGSAQILHTRDGGMTWRNQYRGYVGRSQRSPRHVFAVSPRTAWVVGLGSGMGCCVTRNSGSTWRPRQFATELHPNDLFFVSRKRGWIISDGRRLQGGAAKLHTTRDGGERWLTLELGAEGKPVRIRFINAKRGLLVTDHTNRDQTRTLSELHISGDGGHRWGGLKLFDRKISDLCILDDRSFLVAGEGGFIALSKDGGSNWKRSVTRSRSFINCVRFYDTKTAIAVGDYNTILFSVDAGETWEKIKKSRNVEHFVGATFTSRHGGILVASDAMFSFRLSRD